MRSPRRCPAPRRSGRRRSGCKAAGLRERQKLSRDGEPIEMSMTSREVAQSTSLRMPGPLGWVARSRRRFEPVMLIWLALVGILLFLVVNPVLRLLVSSFEATDGGQFTLANYMIAYGG